MPTDPQGLPLEPPPDWGLNDPVDAEKRRRDQANTYALLQSLAVGATFIAPAWGVAASIALGAMQRMGVDLQSDTLRNVAEAVGEFTMRIIRVVAIAWWFYLVTGLLIGVPLLRLLAKIGL